ncbi:HAMP domain-containing sensor histidine kinase [Nitratireductor sp. XY-223]|uniref:sensor histidine kinase n=1 Tax=Nitratireductor sp. XY-223 TaxID=2561926 RepID=UPI0010A9A2EE|nr:HAMP domain-containing sensor histidine kinase [Nitratireductor sp. XY-223]
MSVRQKWRPPLALIVTGFVALLFVMPTFAMAVVVAVMKQPDELIASLVANWGKIALALIVVAVATAAATYVFWRGLSRPLKILAQATDSVARGHSTFDTDAPYGTREVAQLAEDFSVLVRRLQKRSRYLETLSAHFAHELKSPLTSVRGAAELMRDDAAAMEAPKRQQFLENIISDAEQLSALANRMRDLARADLATGDGRAELAALAEKLSSDFAKLAVSVEAPEGAAIPLSPESAAIVMHHIADNALRHGATALTMRMPQDDVLDLVNNGEPVSEEAREKLFTPFFSTRRQEGGTGLGLAIAIALLASANSTITLHSPDPVTFRIRFSDSA